REFKAVLRNSAVAGVVTEDFSSQRQENQRSMRISKCQESARRPTIATRLKKTRLGRPVLGNRRREPACRLSATSLVLNIRKHLAWRRLQFCDGALLTMRQTRDAVHLRKILLLLPIATQHSTLRRWVVLLSGLSRGMRRARRGDQ